MAKLGVGHFCSTPVSCNLFSCHNFVQARQMFSILTRSRRAWARPSRIGRPHSVTDDSRLSVPLKKFTSSKWGKVRFLHTAVTGMAANNTACPSSVANYTRLSLSSCPSRLLLSTHLCRSMSGMRAGRSVSRSAK